jgi:hypothetical protein
MARLPEGTTSDDAVFAHLQQQDLPGYIDTLEDEAERQLADRIYNERLRPLPPDPTDVADGQGDADGSPGDDDGDDDYQQDDTGQDDTGQGDDDQGDGDEADDQQATGVYDPDQLQDKQWFPLNGQYEFEVFVDSPEWIRLNQGGTWINDVRNRPRLVPGCEGTVDIQHGQPGTWQVSVGALTKVDDAEIQRRNTAVFEAMVAGVEVGEERWANAYYSISTGVVLAGPTEDFDAVGNLGPNLVPGQITFARKRVGANDLKVHGALDRNIVGGYLRQLLDNPSVTYTYRDRGRIKPG